jgi:hypothetical protein
MTLYEINKLCSKFTSYTIKNGLQEEPAFPLWTFGIWVPRSVEEALKIDRETCTNFWVWGNSKGDEKYKARILLLRRWRDSPHSIQVNKMSLTKSYMWTDFTRTSHFVAGGHMIHPLAEISYSSVVLHDSVITFLLMVMILIFLPLTLAMHISML